MKRIFCKKCSLLFAIFLVCMSIISFPRSAQAAGSVGIGMTSFYSWWTPAWRKMSPGTGVTSGLLYGPLISVSFNDKWNLSALYLTSAEKTGYKYDTKWQIWPLYGMDIIFMTRSHGRLIRHDGDLTLSYTINKYLKVFGGAKVNFLQALVGTDSFAGNLKTMQSMPFRGPKQTLKYYNNFGGGLGLATNLKIVDNLYFIANASLLYMYSISRFGSGGRPIKYNVIGCNSTISFSYYITQANLALVAGGRYQYLKFIKSSGSLNPMAVETKLLNDDSYYGVTFSAVYYFNFGQKSADTDDEG